MDRTFEMKCEQHHDENENVIAVCMKKNCEFPSRLMCVSCLTSDHCDHGRYGIKISEFNSQKNINDIVLNWKGENELYTQMVNGLNKFQKELDATKVLQELDEFETKIIEEIKSLRKQILTNLYSKKEQGDEEYQRVLVQLSEYLQIEKIQKIFSYQGSSQNSSDKNASLTMKSVNEQVNQIIKEYNDVNSKPYQSCINLFFNSESLYTYSLDLQRLKEEQQNIQKQIKKLYGETQKQTYLYCFQPSQAYNSQTSLKISGENNTCAIFTNTSSYCVAYLNSAFKLDQKPVEIVFKFESAFYGKHFCIGMRKDSLKDEDSYNKTPYKCLHCQTGDGMFEDTGIINAIQYKSNLVTVQFQPKSKQLVILCDQARCKLNIPFEDKNDLYRLYFWRVSNTSPTEIKIVSVSTLQ